MVNDRATPVERDQDETEYERKDTESLQDAKPKAVFHEFGIRVAEERRRRLNQKCKTREDHCQTHVECEDVVSMLKPTNAEDGQGISACAQHDDNIK
jgi:hypothetical protein